MTEISSLTLEVSQSLLKRINLGDKFTITSTDVEGKLIEQILHVTGICSKGVVDLS